MIHNIERNLESSKDTLGNLMYHGDMHYSQLLLYLGARIASYGRFLRTITSFGCS